MNLRSLLSTAAACSCHAAFLPPPSSPMATSSAAFFSPPPRGAKRTATTRLRGIEEWREQSLEAKYTLDIYNTQQGPLGSNDDGDGVQKPAAIPSDVPILPFPFSDVLLMGQRKQLNLYERRFHDLFDDAMENHAGVVGMGLLAGNNGMITTMPLCEVESYTRFGANEDWIDRGDGMGNGSVIVTIRAVGRAKIVGELLQEEPYMKARVVEIFDEDVKTIGLKEGGASDGVKGESSPSEVASLVAGNIENMMISLSSMQHKLVEFESEKGSKSDGPGFVGNEEKGDDIMNRRIMNARLVSNLVSWGGGLFCVLHDI